MKTQNRLGPCDDFAFEIGDYVDGVLAPERAQTVQAHLGGCPRCRHWHEGLRGVDAALARALPRPALSNEFAANLHTRLDAMERTRRLETADALSAAAREYEQMMASLRGWGWRAALNAAATASVAGCVYAALHSLEPALATAIDTRDPFVVLHLAAPLGVGFALIAAIWTRRFGAASLAPLLG